MEYNKNKFQAIKDRIEELTKQDMQANFELAVLSNMTEDFLPEIKTLEDALLFSGKLRKLQSILEESIVELSPDIKDLSNVADKYQDCEMLQEAIEHLSITIHDQTCEVCNGSDEHEIAVTLNDFLGYLKALRKDS